MVRKRQVQENQKKRRPGKYSKTFLMHANGLEREKGGHMGKLKRKKENIVKQK